MIRRELGGDNVAINEFVERAGKKKTTGWRQVKGFNRMSIDDVEAYATALGWPLDRLLREAKAEQVGTEPDSQVSLSEHVIAQLSPEAQAGVREAQRIIAAQEAEKRRIQGL